MKARNLTTWIVLAAVTVLGACDRESSQGLAPSLDRPGDGMGPSVVFDPLRLPDAEIPFPNDFACAYDEDSPTLCRLNLSTAMTTAVETRVKENVNKLTGFSTFGPISVGFDGPLDLTSLSESTILVIKVPVDDAEAETVQPVPLDLGRGAYPMNMAPLAFFPNDASAPVDNMAFPATNMADRDGDGDLEFVEFYEVETNTLLIRPLLPLDEKSQYAVVLTKGVRGLSAGDGYGTVRSPFPYVNHTAQTPDLERLLPVFDRVGLALDDIAFAWTFTTQDVTGTVRAVREGLYGRGPLAWLDEAITPGFVSFDDSGLPFDGNGTREGMPLDVNDNIVIIQSEYMQGIIDFVAPFLDPNAEFDFSAVDYFAFGWMEAANFMATEDRVWDVDPRTGEATWEKFKIPIIVAVPKENAYRKPPFPVVLYAHGNSTSRFEAILLSNAIAKYGLAVVGMDQIGHGPLAPDPVELLKELGIDLDKEPDNPLALFLAQTLADLMLKEGLSGHEQDTFLELFDLLEDVGLFKALLIDGRALDHNGDGLTENGEGFFVPFPFEQRDVFRQMQVDYVTLVRSLRSLSQEAVPPAIENPGDKSVEELMPNLAAGDLNTDGVLDFGGPDGPIYMAGTSLGGQVAFLVTGLEPEITAAAPLVAGAGLVDVFTRSELRGFFDGAFYFVLGPILSSCPMEDGVYLTFNADSRDGYAQRGTKWDCKKDKVAANHVYEALPLAESKWLVTVTNLDAPAEPARLTVSDEQGGFAIALPSDKGDVWEVVIQSEETGEFIDTFEVETTSEGLGLTRNSPRFRRNVGVFQAIMDPADAANWAPYLLRKPFDGQARNVLQSAVIQDWTIPCGGQVALARIVGNLGLDEATWRANNDKFIDHGLMAGVDFDVDDLFGDNGGFGPMPVIQSETGQSAVRFADVHGLHEYMAILTPEAPFDHAQYTHNMIGLFLASGGTRVEDSLCIEDNASDCLYDLDVPCCDPLLPGEEFCCTELGLAPK
ncbi:MAG: hypothetical protein ISR64_08735 [Deltaproteobacteria bacterium]|nr:hypothetical protein [Deltaproteobacteria bacterium]